MPDVPVKFSFDIVSLLLKTAFQVPTILQDEGFQASRSLLNLPMSRRERLQLVNKERARTERRARAKKRREDLMSAEAELGLTQSNHKNGYSFS